MKTKLRSIQVLFDPFNLLWRRKGLGGKSYRQTDIVSALADFGRVRVPWINFRRLRRGKPMTKWSSVLNGNQETRVAISFTFLIDANFWPGMHRSTEAAKDAQIH
ncbi:hypothetical protein I7I51_01609 [Histoplasma capsulatum]|uniref:Uncharacterized protein n=1 Tax=Ajellomyces capsulatus TaxID=5037 RepID=A0A8A1MF47_AJECA|nr:hypothetical protein I7I51_01609 [Histoplasma capsulatum]